MSRYSIVTHPLDTLLYSHYYGTKKMRKLFSEESMIEHWLRFEAALARAEAEVGLIPEESAREITRKASTEYVKVERVVELHRKTGLDTSAMVKALVEVCDGEAGEYVHWGTTTRDVIETAMAVQLKEALNILIKRAQELEDILVGMAEEHKNTLMVERTFGQHCLPITFGFKVAIWAKEVSRHIEQLKSQREKLVGKVTGAAGTQASFGRLGPRIQELVCQDLGLKTPDITIQISEERLIRLLNDLALIANTLDGMANDIINKNRPEFGELEVGFKVGDEAGSSALPGKRNPFDCYWVRGLAELTRSNARAFMGIVMEDERDGVRVPLEYALISESFCLVDSMLRLMKKVLMSLGVHPEVMERNIHLTPTTLAEAVIMSLAKKGLGRTSAYNTIYDCVNESYRSGRSLQEVLKRNHTVREYLTDEEINTLMNPRNYLGTAAQQIDETLNIIKRKRK